MASRVLCLLVLWVVCVNCAVLKAKAFYCRDPDTGKLHAVNTTWTAASFCGNYTCNIRKRNVELVSNEPIREFNVSKIPDQKQENTTEEVTVTIEKKIEPNLQTLLHKYVTPEARNVVNDEISKKINDMALSAYYDGKNNDSPKGHKCNKNKVPDIPDENDRYLTEKEIDTIADLLHTIKRSDLDAIVDIYNLAQDIYKEMDGITTEEIKQESSKIMQDSEINKKHEIKTPSYWYDPLATKLRINDRYDLHLQNTLNSISTEKTKAAQLSYYNEGLLNNDFGKTSFYYPVTQFQRQSSYTHPTFSFKATTQNTDATRKTEVIKEKPQNENTVDSIKNDPRKLIQPSFYLPYPFTNIHPYNLTESRNGYYGSPWMIDFYNKHRYYQPHYGAHIGPIQKAVLINPHLNNEVQDVEQQNIEQQNVEHSVEIKNENNMGNDRDIVDPLLKGKMSSNWKTDPVSVEVLKDIRADIDTSKLLKAFPLRKKIKLERVGKLINIDDLNSQVSRNKRFAATNEPKENGTELGNYETYLERVTCRDQTKPGYFRIGNLTQPYPECCPQLIVTR